MFDAGWRSMVCTVQPLTVLWTDLRPPAHPDLFVGFFFWSSDDLDCGITLTEPCETSHPLRNLNRQMKLRGGGGTKRQPIDHVSVFRFAKGCWDFPE